jgi:hypothetical protein
MKYQGETFKAMQQVKPGTVAHSEMMLGINRNEPLFLAMDGMIRYAKAHKARYGDTLASDYVLGPLFLQSITALRGLLDGMGAVSMELDKNTDSKDNGVIESMFWAAMEIAGFTEKDI